MDQIATFTAAETGFAEVLSQIDAMGFESGKPHPFTRTILDTFDGRLHRAGLRLELVQTQRRTLRLTGPDIVPAEVVVRTMPRFGDDLPPGPFRARIAAVIDMRALRPVVSMRAVCTPLSRPDRRGKAVVALRLIDDLDVDHCHPADGWRWVLEVEAQLGFERHTRGVHRELEGIGLVHRPGDAMTFAVIAADVDLAGFDGSPSVPLDAGISAIDGFRAVLAKLAAAIDANWQGTIDQVDTEFLHELRVAVRRSRSVLSQGKQVLPPAVVTGASRHLALLGRLTGPARDGDVQLLEWPQHAQQFGTEAARALEPVRLVLEDRRRVAQDTLRAAMTAPETREALDEWRTWLHDPDAVSGAEHGEHAARRLGPFVAKRIARADAALVERGRLIDAHSPPQQVHDLRKDAKKVRYLLECFAGLLADEPRKRFVRRLKDLQDVLGQYQDADVHLTELRSVAQRLHGEGAPAATMLAIGQLMARLDEQRMDARTRFRDRFADYDAEAVRHALHHAVRGARR